MSDSECWKAFLVSVKSGCCTHESFPKVKKGVEPWNGFELNEPQEFHSGLLFILEAPPGGSDHFFWNPRTPDRLRKRVFDLLNEVEKAPDFSNPNTFLQDLLAANCYLLPSFSYACVDGKNRNSNPTKKMVEHSATEHLTIALQCLHPKIIVLMGEKALFAGQAMGLLRDDPRKTKLADYLSLEPYACEKFGSRLEVFVTSWPTKRFVIKKKGGAKNSVYWSYLVPTLNRAFEKLLLSRRQREEREVLDRKQQKL